MRLGRGRTPQKSQQKRVLNGQKRRRGQGERRDDVHKAVGGTTHNQGTIETETDAADRVTVSRQAPHQPAGPGIPQEHGFVEATGGEDVPLGREGKADDVVVVAEQRRHGTGGTLLSAGDAFGAELGATGDPIPEADGLVVGAGGEGVAVGAPGDAADAGHVTDERIHVFPGRCIPDLDRAVGGGAGNPAAVWGNADLRDGLSVAGEGHVWMVVRADRPAGWRRWWWWGWSFGREVKAAFEFGSETPGRRRDGGGSRLRVGLGAGAGAGATSRC